MAGDAVAEPAHMPNLLNLLNFWRPGIRRDGRLARSPFRVRIRSLPASFPVSARRPCVLEQHDLLLRSAPTCSRCRCRRTPIPAARPAAIHLDVDPWEVGKNFPTQVALLGDPKATLPDTDRGAARMTRRQREGRGARRSTATEEPRRIQSAPKKATRRCRAVPGAAARFAHAIGQIAAADAVVVEEALSSTPDIRT